MLLERLKQETHAVERKNAKVSERNIEGRIFFSMNKKGNSHSRMQEFPEGNIEKDKQHHYSMPKHFELRVVEKIFHLTTKANLKPTPKIDDSLLCRTKISQ
jgi:hypothetical protein